LHRFDAPIKLDENRAVTFSSTLFPYYNGNDQRPCEMIGRLQVPDRIAVHPLTNDKEYNMHAQTTLVDLALLGLLELLLSSKSFGLSSSLDCLGFRFSVSDR